MDGWETTFIVGRPIFRCHVSLPGGMWTRQPNLKKRSALISLDTPQSASNKKKKVFVSGWFLRRFFFFESIISRTKFLKGHTFLILRSFWKKMNLAYPNMGKKILIPPKFSWNLKFLVETGDLKRRNPACKNRVKLTPLFWVRVETPLILRAGMLIKDSAHEELWNEG